MKTVVELDLKGYSDIARELEEHFSAEIFFSSRLIAFFSRLIAFESVPPRSPSRAGGPASVLAGPCGAGRWPAGPDRGWPAAGVGASGHALARPAPGGRRGACGPTPGVGTNGRRVAGGGRTRAGGTA